MNLALKSILKGLRYSLYLIFHPFKGFWDLKHEHYGSVASAFSIIALVIITYMVKNQFTGFILNYSVPTEFNILYQITGILIPFFLWCISNWCITTLMDGEGTFKDIMITTAFALAPIVLINIPLVFFSRVITLDEATFYSILNTIAVIWAAGLLVIGIMTVHQFTMKKTLFTVALAVVGMTVLLFILILFLTLVQDMLNFCKLLINEMILRMN